MVKLEPEAQFLKYQEHSAATILLTLVSVKGLRYTQSQLMRLMQLSLKVTMSEIEGP